MDINFKFGQIIIVITSDHLLCSINVIFQQSNFLAFSRSLCIFIKITQVFHLTIRKSLKQKTSREVDLNGCNAPVEI